MAVLLALIGVVALVVGILAIAKVVGIGLVAGIIIAVIGLAILLIFGVPAGPTRRL